MAVRKWYTEQSIQNIADAIRSVDGDETRMLVADMPARILEMAPKDKVDALVLDVADLDRRLGIIEEAFEGEY